MQETHNIKMLIEFKKDITLDLVTLITIKDKLNYKTLTKTQLDH